MIHVILNLAAFCAGLLARLYDRFAPKMPRTVAELLADEAWVKQAEQDAAAWAARVRNAPDDKWREVASQGRWK